MKEMTDKEKEDLLNAAQAQNQQMAGKGDSNSDQILNNTTSYTDFVKPGKVIGKIEIEKIHVNLPIYEGSTDEILEKGVGHLETSSMPVGGESTHSILTGHRGLPTSKLFTDLDKLAIGDTFKITVFDKPMTYKIDQIIVVDPSDVSQLQIVEGKDYCTLITCTPYMINTHRLLVRGIRVENLEEETGVFDTETNKYFPDNNTYDEVLPLVFIIIIIISGLIFISCAKYRIQRIILLKKIKKLRKKLEEYQNNNPKINQIIQKNPTQVIKKNPIENKKNPTRNQVSKPVISDIPMIPENNKDRIKIYDLPILRTSSICEDISIHNPKQIMIISKEGLERIKAETVKIDIAKQQKVSGAANKKSINDVVTTNKIKLVRKPKEIDKSKQASPKQKRRFIRNATATATIMATISCILLKNKKGGE